MSLDTASLEQHFSSQLVVGVYVEKVDLVVGALNVPSGCNWGVRLCSGEVPGVVVERADFQLVAADGADILAWLSEPKKQEGESGEYPRYQRLGRRHMPLKRNNCFRLRWLRRGRRRASSRY